MLRLWLSFKRWLRKLLLELSLKTPIDWFQKTDELVAIANRWLDQQDHDTSHTSTLPSQPESQQEPEHLRRRRERRELFRRSRRKER